MTSAASLLPYMYSTFYASETILWMVDQTAAYCMVDGVALPDGPRRLQGTDVKLTGPWYLARHLLPFVNISVTLVNFQSWGTFPVRRDLLERAINGFSAWLYAVFIDLEWNWSRPTIFTVATSNAGNTPWSCTSMLQLLPSVSTSTVSSAANKDETKIII